MSAEYEEAKRVANAILDRRSADPDDDLSILARQFLRRTELPAGTRLVLASETFLTDIGTRTDDGRRITADWGEPDAHGWYTPTFTVSDNADWPEIGHVITVAGTAVQTRWTGTHWELVE